MIRYRTIDRCLQNRYRKWTLEDLIAACSEALEDYEGIAKGISRRSVQMDIQAMRSDKLGYNAPIVVVDKKYYTYEDPKYSITKVPLTPQDLDTLDEVVRILGQFKGFSHFAEVDGLVQRFEDKIYRERQHSRAAIHFEKNEGLRGLQHLDAIYKAVRDGMVLKLGYKSFTAKETHHFDFHPTLLKEYRNRWFVIGLRNEETMITNLALDRIESLELYLGAAFRPIPGFDGEEYFRDIVGVTKHHNVPPVEIDLLVAAADAPYMETKPLHHSQEVLERRENG
ncbi:MAG: WYL domain-containing protein, partial [Bacteroidia bacterium]